MSMGGNARIGRFATWLLRGGAICALAVWEGGVCLAKEGKTGLETPPSAISGLLTYYTRTSCQAEGTSGVWTASGSRYDESALTLALPHLHRIAHRDLDHQLPQSVLGGVLQQFFRQPQGISIEGHYCETIHTRSTMMRPTRV